ncbi:MAG TPA: type VI secretion system contractile sheath small subunit, partial [Duganella sp.]|nr:type VI secretion system contractile sheath small subunit [Duganella sp.]
VPNQLAGDDSSFNVELRFRAMDDFRPESIVQQVEPLSKLLEARSKLADLRNKLAGNDKLEDILSDVLNNTDKLASLKTAKGN